MWLIFFALWVVPVFTYRYARRNSSSHSYLATGIALGAVAPMFSGALIALPAVGLVGWLLTIFLSIPGSYLERVLRVCGLLSRGEEVNGIVILRAYFFDSLIWATLCGMIGYGLDSLVRWRGQRSN
jgi:hypothetical protein